MRIISNQILYFPIRKMFVAIVDIVNLYEKNKPLLRFCSAISRANEPLKENDDRYVLRAVPR